MGMKKDILHETEEQQLRRDGHVMWMKDCRIARLVAGYILQGKRRRGSRIGTWKDGIRNGMQRRNLKNEEYFDRELWMKKKKYDSWLRNTVYSQKNTCIYIYIV
jgi:hypothetical protein